MAVELDLEWTAEIASEEIEEVTAETLRTLLRLQASPTVHVEGSLTGCDGGVRISIEGKAEVELLLYQVEAPRMRTNACVSFAVCRNAASKVLCLAVALGIAKRNRVQVTDYANLYGQGTSLNPDEALEKLRLKGDLGQFDVRVDQLAEVFGNQTQRS
jgi:hypothetical protein